MRPKHHISRLFVLALLAAVRSLSAAAAVARCILRLDKRSLNQQTVLLAGRFNNLGWFRAHILPLVQCPAVRKIIVVTDAPMLENEKILYACPPGLITRLLGRIIPRLLWLTHAAIRHRPAFIVGYHIMPNAMLALVAARLIGARAVYQCCGGPTEIIAGGTGWENDFLNRDGIADEQIERRLLAIIRRFDNIVVRGPQAARYLRANHVKAPIAAIPAGVHLDGLTPDDFHRRTYDLITVGRLAEIKRLDLFIELIDRLRADLPNVKAAIIGDGPLRASLQAKAQRRGLEPNVTFAGRRDDVARWLCDARLFVLTSASEGLSIALAEAMTAGLPAVVTRVGDLGQLVIDEQTGYTIDHADLDRFARKIRVLLNDPRRWRQFSQRARQRAVALCSPQAVADRWNRLLNQPTTTDPVPHELPQTPYALPWIGKARYD